METTIIIGNSLKEAVAFLADKMSDEKGKTSAVCTTVEGLLLDLPSSIVKTANQVVTVNITVTSILQIVAAIQRQQSEANLITEVCVWKGGGDYEIITL